MFVVKGMTESFNPQVLDAVCVFLCPLRVGKEKIHDLEKYWQDKSLPFVKEERDPDSIITKYKFPALSSELSFGTKGLNCSVVPSVAYAGITDWAVLALEVKFNSLPISFDDLLLFNVGFRRTQGMPAQQDSFFDTDLKDLILTNGDSAASIYDNFASELFPQHTYLPKLTKAILLSYAKFDEPLTDDDLYRFGTVAFANEPASPQWTAQMKDHVFDRWFSSGWRSFVHSYSLVYALSNALSPRQDESIRVSFLRDYFKIGVSIAIQRAWLQEFLGKIKRVKGLKHMRDYHNELVNLQSYFGTMWTSEGTQRMLIEQMWLTTSGVNVRMSDARLLLEQKVAFEEAIETENLTKGTAKLNRVIYYFQFIFGILYGAQIGLFITKDNLLGTILGGVAGFSMIVVVLKVIDTLKVKPENVSQVKKVFLRKNKKDTPIT